MPLRGSRGRAPSWPTSVPRCVRLPPAFEAYANTVAKVDSLNAIFEPFRAALVAAGLRGVADDVLPNPLKVAAALAEFGARVPHYRRRADWFINAVVAREVEVAGYPEPSLSDLTTLYCPEAPHRPS